MFNPKKAKRTFDIKLTDEAIEKNLMSILKMIYDRQDKNTDKQIKNLEIIFDQNPTKVSKMLDTLWVSLPQFKDIDLNKKHNTNEFKK